jgi:hypothetical protein
LIPLQGDSVGVRLDTAAGTAELVIIPILGCMADVLDKCTIVEVGTGILVWYLSLKHTDKQLVTTDSVGVRLDTKA